MNSISQPPQEPLKSTHQQPELSALVEETALVKQRLALLKLSPSPPEYSLVLNEIISFLSSEDQSIAELWSNLLPLHLKTLSSPSSNIGNGPELTNKAAKEAIGGGSPNPA